MVDLHNRVALVTGAGRGLGRAVALALADCGLDVVINYRNREDEALVCANEIRDRGRRALIVRADVSRVDEVHRLVREAEIELGPVTIVINNAGVARAQHIEEITEAYWDELIDVNLKSAFFVSQAVLPAMRAAQWGRIIKHLFNRSSCGGCCWCALCRLQGRANWPHTFLCFPAGTGGNNGQRDRTCPGQDRHVNAGPKGQCGAHSDRAIWRPD